MLKIDETTLDAIDRRSIDLMSVATGGPIRAYACCGRCDANDYRLDYMSGRH